MLIVISYVPAVDLHVVYLISLAYITSLLLLYLDRLTSPGYLYLCFLSKL